MENFEKIFKEKLEKHNGKVRAGAWAGISAGAAGKVATGSGIFSGGAMTYVASIAAGAILAVSGISIWNYNTEDNIPSQNEVVVEATQPTTEETSDEKAVQNLSDIINSEEIKENYVITENKEGQDVKVQKVKRNQLYTKPILSPSAGYAPLTIFFSHESSDGAIIHWNFGDGTESFVNSPSHNYTTPGTYRIVLTAKDKKGNTTTEKRTVVVKESSSILDASKVITPNNDGINDTFKVESHNLVEYKLSVFNRFADLEFETTNTKEPWSGLNAKGEKLPEGVYLYTIKAKGVDGKEYDFNGRIQLK